MCPIRDGECKVLYGKENAVLCKKLQNQDLPENQQQSFYLHLYTVLKDKVFVSMLKH